MSERGFKINYCTCGEILVNDNFVKDKGTYSKLIESGILESLLDNEKYCPTCKEVVKIKE